MRVVRLFPGRGNPRKRNGWRQNGRERANNLSLKHDEFGVMNKHPNKSYSGILLLYTNFPIMYLKTIAIFIDSYYQEMLHNFVLRS